MNDYWLEGGKRIDVETALTYVLKTRRLVGLCSLVLLNLAIYIAHVTEITAG